MAGGHSYIDILDNLYPEEVAILYEASIINQYENERHIAVAMRMAQGAKKSEFKKYLQNIDDIANNGKSKRDKKVNKFFGSIDKASKGADKSGRSK